MTIKLPDDPKEYVYEDLISAMLIASGHYVESRLRYRSGSADLLELDAVATPIDDYLARIIIEVKSGGWGFNDLFKLIGQTHYTGMHRAWLVHRKAADAQKQEGLEELCSNSAVDTRQFQMDDLNDVQGMGFPMARTISDGNLHLLVEALWWSRIADRIAQKRCVDWWKSEGKNPPEVVSASRDYSFAVEQSMFKPKPASRANALYDAYKDAPNLVNAILEHMSGGDATKTLALRKQTWNTHERLPLQYLMTLGNRSRLAIIKNALDHLLENPDEATEAQPAWGKVTWTLIFLPSNFSKGLEALKSAPNAHMVAYFFQVFTEALGGFYFPDDPDDVELVSNLTGVAAGEIATMLDLLDTFFPINNGWVQTGKHGMVMLKAVPAYMRGAGCCVRSRAFAIDKYEDRFKGNGWHMGKWHNALYEILRKDWETA